MYKCIGCLVVYLLSSRLAFLVVSDITYGVTRTKECNSCASGCALMSDINQVIRYAFEKCFSIKVALLSTETKIIYKHELNSIKFGTNLYNPKYIVQYGRRH